MKEEHSLEELVKLLAELLSKDGDYAICRSDGVDMGIGEAIMIGEIMAQIDEKLKEIK